MKNLKPLQIESRNLARADTFRELYQTRFPQIIAPLIYPEVFADLHIPEAARLDTDLMRQDNLFEVVDLIQECESVRSSAPFHLQMEARREKNSTSQNSKSDFCISGIRDPGMRIYQLSSQPGIRYVDHQDALDIFETHTPRMLDLEMCEENFSRFHSSVQLLTPLFAQVARPLPAETLAVMTGVTLQHSKIFPAGSLFLQARAFSAD